MESRRRPHRGKKPNERHRQQHTARKPGGCPEERLGHQLAHDAADRCTERHAHEELPTPRLEPGVEQRADVDARHQQYRANGGAENAERSSRIPDEKLAQRDDARRPERCGVRVLELQPAIDGLQVTLRVGRGDRRRHPRQHADLMKASLRALFRRHQPRDPDLGLANRLERPRHDADDDIGRAIDEHRPPDDARVAPELPIPQAVRDDDNASITREVGRCERPAHLRVHTEYGKKLVGDF